jgi:hypothetical protein
MARPVTVFTGQSADLAPADLAPAELAEECGGRTRTSAIGASTRSLPSTSLPSGSSRRRRSGAVRGHLVRDGAVYLFWDVRHSRRSEPGTSGTSWPTVYARADAPSTGCWSRTCAQSPRSARSGGPGADEHGPQRRVAFPFQRNSWLASHVVVSAERQRASFARPVGCAPAAYLVLTMPVAARASPVGGTSATVGRRASRRQSRVSRGIAEMSTRDIRLTA